MVIWERVNSLPNDKIFDRFNLKTVAENKSNVILMMRLAFNTAEDIVGKGEIAGNQHFFFVLRFQKLFFAGLLKVEIVL